MNQIDLDFNSIPFPNQKRKKDNHSFGTIKKSRKIIKNILREEIIRACLSENYSGVTSDVLEFLPKNPVMSYLKDFPVPVRKVFRFIFWQTLRLKYKSKLVYRFHGLYSPATPNNIYLVDEVRSKNEEMATISHEHIHLLQNRSLPRIRYPKTVFNEKLIGKKEHIKECRYFLNRYEFEARLHELMLTHKLNGGQLPETIEDFKKFLEESFVFSPYLSKGIRPVPVNVRSFGLLDDLDLALYGMEEDEVFNFISGVVPMMYCNLLLYYGYEDLFEEMMSQIPDKNIHHKFYVNN